MSEQLQRHLLNARFEVLPLPESVQRVKQLASGTPVTVTASPTQGEEATLDLAAEINALGLNAVPHLAARLVRDRKHLVSLLDRMDGIGVRDVFVIAGDSTQPEGEFPDALALLRAMTDIGRKPSRVGITGYPETHSMISDSATVQAMAAKAEFADYIVSQICYDPQKIASWIKDVRARGIEQPVYIGSPGAVDPTKLLRISLRIGLGESVRFLRKQHGVTKLLTRYTPEELFHELSPYLVDPTYGVAGWHFFTFNEVGKTAQWRDVMAARMHEIPA